jgi:SAM-dependent methyltransferase
MKARVQGVGPQGPDPGREPVVVNPDSNGGGVRGWWVAGALTGNRPEAALDNARLEGVLDRVEVKEGDVRQLPFAHASFDVVLSNFVVHEVKNRAEREQMLREMVRVLKPGGRLALVDFIFTGECVRVFQEIGIADAKRARVGSVFSFWLGAALNFGLVQTYQVTGSKPSMTGAGDAQAAQGSA